MAPSEPIFPVAVIIVGDDDRSRNRGPRTSPLRRPQAGRVPMRLLKDNSLTIVLLLLFAGSIIGQWLTGWHVALEDAARHGEPALSLGVYTRSEAHTSELQSLMRISYAVFCLKKQTAHLN